MKAEAREFLRELLEAEKRIPELRDGESWIWPEGDYGKAEVWRKNDRLFLFSIPMYGGEPSYVTNYRTHAVGALVREVLSWT
jgi:hypothetical protein